MPTLTLESMNNFFENAKSDRNVRDARSESSGLVVKSAELLNGARTIAIEHNGSLYRLQETRFGKLILTK